MTYSIEDKKMVKSYKGKVSASRAARITGMHANTIRAIWKDDTIVADPRKAVMFSQTAEDMFKAVQIADSVMAHNKLMPSVQDENSPVTLGYAFMYLCIHEMSDSERAEVMDLCKQYAKGYYLDTTDSMLKALEPDEVKSS